MTRKLSTSLPRLDQVLGGGLTPGSLVFVVGGPGVGKTILAHQICFGLATETHKAMYYTMLSEPHPKLIDHLNDFTFFDQAAIGRRVEFLNLASLVDPKQSDEPSRYAGEGLDAVIDIVARSSIEERPAVIVIDSIRALRDMVPETEFRSFIYRLASRIALTDALLFLVGEYAYEDVTSGSEFAVSDGIIYLANDQHGRVDQRWLRILKIRGGKQLSGKHSVDIGPDGIEVYPRFEVLANVAGQAVPEGRAPLGIPAVDAMVAGGFPRGSATLVAGPSGAGKTVAALHFIADGIQRGEHCMYLSFQQTSDRLVARARAMGWDFAGAQASGLLDLRFLEPVELSLDVIGMDLIAAIQDQQIQRVVIDSFAEIEPTTRDARRFPDFLSSVVGLFRSMGATSLFTSETTEIFGPNFELPRGLAALADNIILLRFLELNSRIHRTLAVMKMRDGIHDTSLMEIQFGAGGLRALGTFVGLGGVLTGAPTAQPDIVIPEPREFPVAEPDDERRPR